MSNTLKEAIEEWTTHTAANGLTYYYNTKTKKSTWTKPDCLKSFEEKYNSTDWQEYTTSDGKVFYHNSKLKKSVWKMPPELKSLKEKQAEERKAMAAKAEKTGGPNALGKITFSITSSIQEEPEEAPVKKTTGTKELSKDDAIKLFMDLLRDKNIGPPMKWEQCQNVLSADDRYNAIKGIGEKKRIFNEYIQMTKKAERNEVRNKIEQAKENFVTMLETSGFLTSDSKYHKVAQQFLMDQRWKMVEERDREILFQDFLDDLYNKEKEEMRIKRKENMEKFKNMLLSRDDITSRLKWDECVQMYKEDMIFNSLTNYDQLIAFSEVIFQLEQKEYEEKRKVKRNNERKNREAFRVLLHETENVNVLIYKTKWKDFVQKIKDDPRLINMLGQPGSTPRELFEDHIEILKENHKKTKDELKKYLKSIHFKVTLETSQEEFEQKMKDCEHFSSLPDNKRNFYYHYCINKAKSKEKEVLKKQKKAYKKFKKVLRLLKEMKMESTYEDFKPIIDENASHYSLIPEEERRQLFEEFKSEYLKDLPLEEKSSGDEKVQTKNKKKKKKHAKTKETHGEESSHSPSEEKPKSNLKQHGSKKRDKPDHKADPDLDLENLEKIEKKFKLDQEERPKPQENPPEPSNELLEQFKKLEEEISKIKSAEILPPPENQNQESNPVNIMSSEEKLKEEGELDIKKTEKFIEEELKADDPSKKKVSQSHEKKRKEKKKEKKSHRKKEKDKKTHKKKEKRRSRSKKKSRNASSSSDDEN